MEIRRTDLERIAQLETGMVNLASQITNVGLDVKDIKLLLSTTYVSKESVDRDLRDLRAEINKLQINSGFWRWMSPTLSAVAGSVITYLILSYIGKLA